MTALPDSLTKEGLFCCWRYEERNGRRTKVPYQPDTGQGAKSNDPRSFVSYETAMQASGYDGIGIGIFNGICAIDLDGCVTDSGYYSETAAEIQKAKFVMAKLKKKNISTIKRSDLFQMCRGKFFKKTEEIFPTLELLEGHGYLRLEEPERQSVGRPADVRIFVNPAAA